MSSDWVGIVVSRFNSFITERLLAAAMDALQRAGASDQDVDVVHVPGAFELPLAAIEMAQLSRKLRGTSLQTTGSAKPRRK